MTQAKKPAAKPAPKAPGRKRAVPVKKTVSAPVRKARKPKSEKLAATSALDDFCSALRGGKLITEIAKSWGVPLRTLVDWIAADSARSARVREARAAAAQQYDERAEAGILAARDPFELARAKEVAHHLRWRASKINPRDYGDKLELDNKVTLQDVSDEALLNGLAKYGITVPILGGERQTNG